MLRNVAVVVSVKEAVLCSIAWTVGTVFENSDKFARQKAKQMTSCDVSVSSVANNGWYAEEESYGSSEKVWILTLMYSRWYDDNVIHTEILHTSFSFVVREIRQVTQCQRKLISRLWQWCVVWHTFVYLCLF